MRAANHSEAWAIGCNNLSINHLCTYERVFDQVEVGIQINVVDERRYVRSCGDRKRGFTHAADHHRKAMGARNVDEPRTGRESSALHELEVHT